MSINQEDDKNQDDIDSILASMDGDDVEDMTEPDPMKGLEEPTEASENKDKKIASPKDKKDQKSNKTDNLSSKSSAKKKLGGILSSLVILKKIDYKSILRSQWAQYFTTFAFGGIAAIILILSAYQILQYLSPKLLNPNNIQLSSTVVNIPEFPKDVTELKSEDAQDLIDQIAVDAQKQDATIPLAATTDKKQGEALPYNFHQIDSALSVANDKPLISIVLNDVGLSKSRMDSIIKSLPSGTSIALSPYISEMPNIKTQRDKLFEIWMTLPTEKSNIAHDPGILGLYNSRDLTLNMNALTSLVNKHNGFTGFVLPPYSSFPKENQQYHRIVKKIYEMGYGILDASFLSIPPLTMTLGRTELPYFEADIVIDQELSQQSIEANFKKLEIIAKENRQAIAMIHPYPLSLNVYEDWSKTLNEKNIAIVPLSDLFKKP